MQYKTTCDFVDYAEVAMELELDQSLVKVKNIPRSRKLDSLNCFHMEGWHKVKATRSPHSSPNNPISC